jgi:hypothetical protein
MPVRDIGTYCACYDRVMDKLNLTRLVPALGLMGKADEGAHCLGARFGPAHAQIVGDLPAQTVEHGVSGQAEDEAGHASLAVMNIGTLTAADFAVFCLVGFPPPQPVVAARDAGEGICLREFLKQLFYGHEWRRGFISPASRA